MEFLKLIGTDILTNPAFILGIISLIGLIALKKPFNELIIGTLKPILGYIMLGAGAEFIVKNLTPLGKMLEKGFGITGIVLNNEAITSIAQNILGKETMFILVFGLILNILIARFTRFKYIFLTGHHSFYMACMLAIILAANGIKDLKLILIGGGILGIWSALSPKIGQKYTDMVTNNNGIAMGHFGSLGYYLAAFIGEKIGNKEDSTENIIIPEKLSFLKDSIISTAITMLVFYILAALVAGSDYVITNISNGKNYVVFSINSALGFAVGVSIVYEGVKMILSELIPAFKGISQKLIPNATPAVDCTVFYTYAPNAVLIGFIFSFFGGLVGMFILGGVGLVIVIPGLVSHFFGGAAAGIYGNATGGKRGAIVGSFISGFILTIFSALLLPHLGEISKYNITFGDIDFCLIGLFTSFLLNYLGIIIFSTLIIIIFISLFIFSLTKDK